MKDKVTDIMKELKSIETVADSNLIELRVSVLKNGKPEIGQPNIMIKQDMEVTNELKEMFNSYINKRHYQLVKQLKAVLGIEDFICQEQ